MSSQTLKEITIDGQNYELGFWQPDDALEVLTWLIKTFGGSLSEVIVFGVSKAGDGLESFADMETAELAEPIKLAITTLSDKLQAKDIKTYMRRICTDQVLCDKKPVEYNKHFAGRIGHMFHLFVLVIRHQFHDFFSFIDAKDVFRRIMEKENPDTSLAN